MILDRIENAERYAVLHPLFAKAFEYIRKQQQAGIEPGKFAIDGALLHASASLKDGVSVQDAKFEAHDRYIDIQFCPEGSERMGWSPRITCHKPKAAYNEEKDVTFFDDKPQMYFQLNAGEFVIFYPEDVHAPMIGEGPVKKLVVKVKIEHN
jgi:biofilm protein TabA